MSRFHDYTLDEAIEIAKRNDPGEKVPSVSRTLIAEIRRSNAQSERLAEAFEILSGSYKRLQDQHNAQSELIERLRAEVDGVSEELHKTSAMLASEFNRAMEAERERDALQVLAENAPDGFYLASVTFLKKPSDRNQVPGSGTEPSKDAGHA